MANLLSPAVQQVIKTALQSVIDTFFRKSIVLNSNVSTPDGYGEGAVIQSTHTTFNVLVEPSVGKSARYENVRKAPMGQEEQYSWHVYFWTKDIIDSGIVIDPETDTVTFDGVDYEIRLFTPSALFDDLGFLLHEMELKLVAGATSPGTPTP